LDLACTLKEQNTAKNVLAKGKSSIRKKYARLVKVEKS